MVSATPAAYLERVAKLISNKFNELRRYKIGLLKHHERKTKGEQEQNAIRVFSAVDNSFVFSDHLCDTLYLLLLQVFHMIRPIQNVSQIRPCWGQKEITTHRKSMLLYTGTAFAKHEDEYCDTL
jgi:hypothetical protein